MALVDVIASFRTPGGTSGAYVVTRTASGAHVAGAYVPGSTSTVNIVASVRPANGRQRHQAEVAMGSGEYGVDTRVVYTTTELRTRQPGNDPDTIAINGEAFKIVAVTKYEAFGVHYKALVARIVVP